MARLYLAQSYPGGWGVEKTSEAMKLHLAERDPQHHAWAKRGVDRENMQLRILLSYWYYKDTDLDALFKKYFSEPYPDVFADSGGFSADSQGARIDLNDYAAWVKRYAHLFSTYANLDVIGNPEQTAANQKRLEDLGLAPLPVFHVGSDWAHLENYIEQYQYIALGGMVPYMRYREKIMPWLVKAFKLAQGKSVFHGFGATSWIVVCSLPWYSVDSSSWGQGFRYGQVPLFDSGAGKFKEAKLGDIASCQKNAALIHSLGFDWRDFADRKRNDRAKICAISALSYMKAEQWLRKRHGEIRIPQSSANEARLRLHLVDSPHTPLKDTGDASAVLRLHLVTAQANASADKGSNMSINALGLADVQGASGVRLHLSDTSNGVNFGDADKGLKVYGAAGTLAREVECNAMTIPTLASGLKIHLAEHSLDIRGGVGDTSRAMEWLKQLPS